MRKIERLKKEALGTCKWRGHVMRRFKKDGSRGSISTCKKCDMTVSIIPGYSYEIIGEAVALNCK